MCPAGSVHDEACAVAFDRFDACTGEDGDTARDNVGMHRVDECLHSRTRRRKHRVLGACRCRFWSFSRRDQQAATLECKFVQLGHAAQRKVVGVGGINAADQRVDQHLVHFTTESTTHECAEAVVVGGGSRHQWFEGGARLASRRDQARPNQ